MQALKRMRWSWNHPSIFDDGPVGAQHPGVGLGADMPPHPSPTGPRSALAVTIGGDGCAHLQWFDAGALLRRGLRSRPAAIGGTMLDALPWRFTQVTSHTP